jgi:hypothetical protein
MSPASRRALFFGAKLAADGLRAWNYETVILG